VAGFQRIKSRQVDFVEEKHIPLLARPLVSRGQIVFVAPADLVRRTESPEWSVLWLRADRLKIRDAAGEKVVDVGRWGPAKILVSSYLHVLSGDLAWLEQRYTVDFQCRAGRWRFRLAPTDASLAKLVKTISLSGKAATLEQLEVVDANGDVTRTTFSSVASPVSHRLSDLEKLYAAPPGP
jgi:hypothetical protein